MKYSIVFCFCVQIFSCGFMYAAAGGGKKTVKSFEKIEDDHLRELREQHKKAWQQYEIFNAQYGAILRTYQSYDAHILDSTIPFALIVSNFLQNHAIIQENQKHHQKIDCLEKEIAAFKGF